MKKVLASMVTLGIIAAGATLATSSFFSDTETSSGNVFAAGDIDLKIGNQSYYNGEASPNTSWNLRDLTVEKFFNFLDVKPGDHGEDVIQVQVGSNEAFMCANVQITENSENGLTEPETDEEDDATTGELASSLNFAFWVDDGDNVYETGEQLITSGPASNVLAGGTIALADSDQNLIGGAIGTGVSAGASFNIGKAWCFGSMTAAQLTDVDTEGRSPITDNNSDTKITSADAGFLCDGSGASNDTQTDRLIGDMSFYAVQVRNNPTFQCNDSLFPNASPTSMVGSLLAAYDDPATCTDTVSGTESVQAAINAAPAGSTICVDSTYDKSGDNTFIEIPADKAGTVLAGVGAAGAASLDQGVLISADNAKVTGLTLGVSTTLNETFGVYVNSNVDGAEVSYNTITGAGTASGRGIVNATGTTSNATYKHNKISNWLTGIFNNPSSGMIAEYNDLFANGVGIANDNPSGNMIRYNDIENNSIEGIGANLTGANTLIVTMNNITGHPAGNDLVSSYGTEEVSAENNWWGDTNPADNVNGLVDFTPNAMLAFAEN